MKTLDVYQITECDEYGSIHIGYFTNKSDAIKCASENRGYYTITIKETIITIFDTYDDYKGYRNEQIKQKALEKLTLEERKSLGY